MSIRTPEKVKRKVTTKIVGKALTEQCHAEHVKIQNIIASYRETGIVTHLAKWQGKYMDLPGTFDFKQAQDLIAEAGEMFLSVPSHIREQFENNPAKFVEFMQNPENIEKMEELGFTADHLEGVMTPSQLELQELRKLARTVAKASVTPLMPAGEETPQSQEQSD